MSSHRPVRPLLRWAVAPLLIATCGLCIVPDGVSAQRHDWDVVMPWGQNPPGLNWKTIDTPHFEVIFPAELEKEGQRVANTLEHVYGPVAKTLESNHRRISILLPNQSTISNGFVSPVTWHSAFYSTPPQQGLLGTNEWYTLLATHEVRHVVQHNRANTGFTRILGFLFGNLGSTLPHIFIPGWWGEGDAVGTETALSQAGRGRQPEFDMEIRTLLLSGQRPDYQTARLRSYRLRYPNEYHLGYLLTTYVKRTYGPDVWARVIARTGETAYNPLAFSVALKKETGKGEVELYEAAMDELTALWTAQLEAVALTDARVLNSPEKDIWTNYVSPQYAADGSVVALKWGMDDRHTLVRLDSTGRETSLYQLDPSDGRYSVTGGQMSVAGSRVVWAENVPDPRWAQRDYSVIRLYDLATGSARTLTHRSKLFSPALSPDMRRIAAVEFSTARQASLIILDAETGAEVQRIPSPDNEFLSAPSWSPDGGRIVLTRQATRGKALSLVNLSTAAFRDLIPHSHENISQPVLHGRYVFHNSSYSGIDNIYAVDLETGDRYQVTSRKFGAFNPAVSSDGSTMAFNDYTARGSDAVEMPIEPTAWMRLEDVEDRSVRYYEPLIAQEAGGSVLEDIPSRTYEVSDYREISHLLNVHTWYVGPSGTIPSVSVGITSVNKLNTLGFGLGYEYDRNEKTNALSFTSSYQGWYPILDLGARLGGRSSTYVDSSGKEQTYSWSERSLEAGVRLPLDLSRGIYGQFLGLGVHAALVDISGQTQQFRLRNGDGLFAPVTYDLTFSRVKSWGRQILPERGQSLQLAYSHTPFAGDYHGSLLSATARQYFPGLGLNHGAYLGLGYERQRPDSYRFPFRVTFPRGHNHVFHENLYTASLNYALPLAYPDFNMGTAVNVPRITANAFLDYARGTGSTLERSYSSTGLELMAEVKLISFPASFFVGTRYSYLISSGQSRFDSIFGVGL